MLHWFLRVYAYAIQQFRTLLHQCSVDALRPHDVLDVLLSYLENHLPSVSTTWSGKAHTLSTGAEAAVALLHVLTDRWLPYFEYVAIIHTS